MINQELFDDDAETAKRFESQLGNLRESAKGWQKIQFGLFGFIGLCGVLKPNDGGVPHRIQVIGGLLALLALGVTCVAAYLVGRAANPTLSDDLPDDHAEALIAERRMQTGLVLTFVAVAIVALSALTNWWPTK